MGDINKIYEALLNRKGKVCNKEEITEMIKEYKTKFKCKLDIENTIKYLSRHKYIKRIFQSYYYVNSMEERKRDYCECEDKDLLFIVLNKLNIKWYVGLGSALYLNKKIWQVPRVLHILNNKFSGVKKILSLKVRFFKIKDTLFFGLKKNKGYLYSDVSKSYLDMVYLKKIKIKNKKKEYLRYYPKWVGKK